MTIFVQAPEAAPKVEDEQSPIHQSAAEMAAYAYFVAVRATTQFVNALPGTPTKADLAQYTSLLERENIAWQRRREAFAALGLHHEPESVYNEGA